MSGAVFIKQPSEVKGYAIDFENLLAETDSLNAIVSVTGTPAGLTISDETISGTQVTFTLAGGQDGTLYTIEAIATTTGGETLEGDGYLVVTDTPTPMADTLAYGYQTIRTAIADYLGWGRADTWSDDEAARLDAVIKSAVTQVYYPASVAREGVVHQWSWMRPLATLTTTEPYSTGTVAVTAGVVTLSDGTWPDWAAQADLRVRGEVYAVASRSSDTELVLEDLAAAVSAGESYQLVRYVYDLPRDFGGFEGEMTFRNTPMVPAVRYVSDAMIRRRRQSWDGTARPEYVALRPKRFVAAIGQRWQMVFHPSPSDAYTLAYRYKVQPTTLSDAHPYPLGGPEIGELVLQACLAVAEQRYRDERGAHTELFLERLRAAVANDAQSYAPDTLGYNADRESVVGDRFGGAPIHTYEGVAYYDRNL